MAELKQHALLLSLVALLIVAKFIVVPLFSWQNTLLSEISLLTNKQMKINKVLANQSRNQQLNDELSTTLKPLEKLFFPHQADATFKLAQQKKLESLLAEYHLKAENVGWQVTTVFDSLAVVRYPIQIRFTGKTIDVIQFLAKIETNDHRMEVDKLNLSLKGQRGGNLGSINGNITLFLFMEQVPKVTVNKKVHPASSIVTHKEIA